MTRRSWLIVGLLVAVVVALGLLAERPEAGPTTYGGQAEGLLSAHDYLLARGQDVRRWEEDLSRLPRAEGTLVVAAPFPVPWTEEDTRALRRWASQGGTVLILASGGEPGASEARLLESFGITVGPRREPAPLGWRGWAQWRQALARVQALDPALPPDLVMRLESHGPRAPKGATVHYADREGRALAWTLPWPPGQVTVLANASPWANAGLGEGDNLELLELLAAADPPLWFDERHHGHLAPEAMARSTALGPFELLVAHVLLLYLLAAWTISRPLGPALAAEPDRRGSVRRDLLSLARLHRRSGHAEQAGQRLLQLAWDLARRRGSQPPELPRDFSGGEAELQELARTVGRLQAEGRL